MTRPTVIDLFCGAGGFSLGFKAAGFELLRAVDTNLDCIETYERNFGRHAECGSVSPELLADLSPDVVIGGPPCQPFSLLGAKSDCDPRQGLTKNYMDVVVELNPKVFVIENVPGYFKSEQSRYVGRVARRHGYQLSAALVDASEHGVAQNRKRAFIIGSRVGIPFFPLATGLKPSTVREAIDDLNNVPTGMNWHVGRRPEPVSVRRYRAVPPGGNRLSLPRSLQSPCWRKHSSGSVDVFGRLWWDRPSVTIRTEFIKPEKGRYLHPELNRPITPREGARLQSFPDSFQFAGSMTSVVRQIGNAVPPRLAYRLALAVKRHLAGVNSELGKPVTSGLPTTVSIDVLPSGAQDSQFKAALLGQQ